MPGFRNSRIRGCGCGLAAQTKAKSYAENDIFHY